MSAGEAVIKGAVRVFTGQTRHRHGSASCHVTGNWDSAELMHLHAVTTAMLHNKYELYKKYTPG